MPRALFYIILSFLLLLFTCQSVCAQLKTNELGQSDKDRIDGFVNNVRERPGDDDVAFAESQNLINEEHIVAFRALKGLYENGSELIKAKIVKAIGVGRDKVVGAPEYWEILVQALESTDKVLAQEVVMCLARLESEQYFGKLLEKIKSKGCSRTSTDNIIKTLCRFETGGSKKTILTTDTIGIRIEAVKALSGKGDKPGSKCLVDALGKKFGVDFSDQRKLDKWWDENKSKSVAQIFEEAARKHQKATAIEKERAEKSRQKAVAATNRYFELLFVADKPKAITEALAKLGNPETEPEVLVYLIKKLGELEEKKAFEPLCRQLQSELATVRIAAIEALGAIKDPKALPEVHKKLQAKAPGERLAAVNTITRLGSTSADNALRGEAGKILLAALEKEKEQSVLRSIIQGLGGVGLPAAVVPLVGLAAVEEGGKLKLRDTVNNDFRVVVANSLGKILCSQQKTDTGHRKLAISYMQALLAVENVNVKFAAIDNLGNVGAKEAAESLVKVLTKSANTGLRSAAARALGKVPGTDENVWNALLGNLNDKTKEVADDCMRALRNIAGLNGAKRRVNLARLSDWAGKLKEEEAHGHIRTLLKNLPEEKDLAKPSKEAKDKLYRLRGVLAEAHMKASDFKAATIELEKVVAYFKDSPVYLEMLAQVYAAQGLHTKAIDEYNRLINVNPQQATKYWQETLKLIVKISDNQEKLKRIDEALKKKPPEAVKKELEQIKQQLSGKPAKGPKNP